MTHCVLWGEKDCGNFWVQFFRHFHRTVLTVWFSNSFLGRVLPPSQASEETCLPMYQNCSVTDNNCCPPFRCLNFSKLNDHGWYALHSRIGPSLSVARFQDFPWLSCTSVTNWELRKLLEGNLRVKELEKETSWFFQLKITYLHEMKLYINERIRSKNEIDHRYL